MTRAVVQERLRTETPEVAKGIAYDIYADVLTEFGRNARVGTFLIRVFRESTDATAWRIARLNVLTTVRGLYRLSVNPGKQYRIANLALSAEDFELRVPSGVAFVAETDAGVTGIVILGRGEMIFSPTPAAEKGQVKIYSGGDVHTSRFDWVYLRAHPAEFDRRLDVSTFHAREVDARDLRRAEAVFQENLPRSFGIELADLSRDRWSVIPKFGDLVAEMNTDRAHLTYMKSVNDAEDIRFFDRTRSRTISIYPSKEKLATRGPFFNEDDQVDFDIVNYDIDASFDPRREWIDGKATLLVTARRDPISSIVLSLAEPLTVRSVTSTRHGYLMALRVSGQDDIIINLPEPLRQDELLDLEFVYGGRLPATPPEREAIDVGGRVTSRRTSSSTFSRFRATSTPGARAGTRREMSPTTQRRRCACAYPKGIRPSRADRSTMDTRKRCRPRGAPHGWSIASAPRSPCAIWAGPPAASFTSTRRRSRSTAAEGDDAPLTGASYTFGEINVESSSMLQRRGRELFDETQRVMKFYGSVVSDIPYPSFTLAIVEREQPGGHSPPYFAALSHPPPATPISWRTDPAYFDGFPEFFLAHESAHQWWGQAVGWKNYHEQWISEGFAQYFAAMYAEHVKKDGVFRQVIAQMARWTLDRSDQGPVYLGYRLGHIRNDGRVFRALVYNKGALTLHMLRKLIGDDAFFRGLRRFYATWRFKKAGTEDVKAAFELEANRDLDAYFDRWIYGSSLPRMKFSYTTEPDAVVVRFEQIGERFECR